MAAENQRQEIPSVRSAIEGESSSQSSTQGNVHGKDLVTRIFGDPEALSMLREAIFSEASSRSSSDARALKAHHEASEITAPASKRPRGAEPLEQEVVVLDPEPINQDDAHVQANTSIIDDEAEGEYSFSASRWQASDTLTSFLGTIHKPLSTFDRKAICRSYPRPDVDAVYTPAVDTYLTSLVPGVKTVDKENKFLQDRLLDAVVPLSQSFEHIQGLLSETARGNDVTLSYAQLNELSSMTANSIRLIGNASALMSKQRRGTILSKINSSGALSSLASEDFPDAGKFLFGEGFEARIKTRSETAKTLLQAAQVGQRSSQFFRGRTTQFRKRGSRWSGAQRRPQSFNNNNYQFRGSFKSRPSSFRGFKPVHPTPPSC